MVDPSIRYTYTLHSDTILCNFTKTNKQYIWLHTDSTAYTIISFGWQTRSNFNRYNLTLPPLSVNSSYARKWAFLILHDEISQEPPNFCLKIEYYKNIILVLPALRICSTLCIKTLSWEALEPETKEWVISLIKKVSRTRFHV